MVQKTGDLQLPRMLALPRPIKDTGSLTECESGLSKGERSLSISGTEHVGQRSSAQRGMLKR